MPSPNAARRLGRRGRQRRGQVRGALDAAHPPSPAAGRRLDQQREPDRLGLGDDRRRPRPGGRPAPARASRAPSSTPARPREPPRARACRPAPRWPRRSARRTSARPRRRRARTPLARRGTRSPGWTAWAPVDRGGVEDRVDPQVALGRRPPDRAGPRRRRAGRASRRRRHRCRPRPSRSPASRQARMIRTAISPRLAIRTRSNGRPSLRKDGSGAPPRQSGMLPCFFRGLVSRLSASIAKRADQPGSRLRRPDDVVDVAAPRRDVRVRRASAS